MFQKLLKLRLYAFVLCIDAIFFSTADPANGSSFLLIAGCIILVFSVYAACYGLLSMLLSVGLLTAGARKRLCVFLTIFIAFLVFMQSIGQLSARDVLAVIPFVAALYIYTSYASKRTSVQNSYIDE